MEKYYLSRTGKTHFEDLEVVGLDAAGSAITVSDGERVEVYVYGNPGLLIGYILVDGLTVNYVDQYDNVWEAVIFNGLPRGSVKTLRRCGVDVELDDF